MLFGVHASIEHSYMLFIFDTMVVIRQRKRQQVQGTAVLLTITGRAGCISENRSVVSFGGPHPRGMHVLF
jgi:hypothetical protein